MNDQELTPEQNLRERCLVFANAGATPFISIEVIIKRAKQMEAYILNDCTPQED